MQRDMTIEPDDVPGGEARRLDTDEAPEKTHGDPLDAEKDALGGTGGGDAGGAG